MIRLSRVWPWRNRNPWPRITHHRPPCKDPSCQPCLNDAFDEEYGKWLRRRAEGRTATTTSPPPKDTLSEEKP